jgi:protein arginine kinase activator
MSETSKPDPGTCEACGSAPASVHLRRVNAGEEVELHLCLDCAREQGVEGQAPAEGAMFADPLALMFQNLKETDGEGTTCPSCGLTYSRFRETGRLGCAVCYQTFLSQLEPLLRRVQGATRHTGKVPVREGSDYERTARLRRLNEELERAIGAEDFERAAELRDLIQGLESAGSGTAS